jgi:type II secretory pathway component PulF
MLLTYEAVDRQGKPSRATLEAASPVDAVEQLRRRGLFVTQMRESAPLESQATGERPTAAKNLPLRTLVLFTRQMAMLLRAGSAVVPAIDAIKRQMKPPYACLLAGIISDLQDGAPLTEAMRKYPQSFDSVYCAVIAAGEASGKLTEMFERLTGMVGKKRAMRNKILGALAYPALLIGLCIKIIGVLLFFVLPRFADMFQQLGVQTPSITSAMLACGEFVRTHWSLVLFGIVAVGAGIGTALSTPRGRQWLGDIQLKLPLIGHLRSRLIQAQFLRTMGTLLESGVGVLEALELARASTTSKPFQRLFSAVENAVTSGGQLSGAFLDSGLVESYICQAVRTGEESGRIGEAMTYSADILDETNAELLQVIAKLIEPAILISMGVFVGGVAVSLFLPLFDLTSAMH